MKGIEWIKLATCMCEDEKMRLIDSMEERDPTHYVWIRLLLQAGKVNDNGFIYLKENISYTKEMLSILFNRPLPIIERCLEILESFEMIEIYEDNTIRICNWEKHQNIEGMKRVREGTRNRVRNHREKKKMENNSKENKDSQNEIVKDESNSNKSANEEKELDLSEPKTCNANVTHKREKREKENKNKKKKLDKESIVKDDANNALCTMGIKADSCSELNIKLSEVSQSPEEEMEVELSVQAIKFIKSLEETKVNIKGLTLAWMEEALSMHKEKYIKMAINKAIERNKFDIYYISGILKNWLNEGYPKTYEDMEFKVFSSENLSLVKEKPKLRFNNFEPRNYDYDDLEKKLLGWKE
jgi:predicted phage replisome organizer